MIIRELCLRDFGKFKDAEFSLDEGMNIIYGGNESGKTSIRDFILFILFGGNYSSYANKSTGICAGSLGFEYNDRRYEASRSRLGDREEFVISDMDSGEIRAGQGGIDSLIKGLSPAFFENAITFTRSSDQDDAVEYEELSERKAQLDIMINDLKEQMKETTPEYEEKLKAVELIKRNNEIAEKYKEKKNRLDALGREAAAGGRINSPDLELFERKRDELGDIRENQRELREEAAGGAFKALAFSIPIILAGGLMWLFGASLGLQGIIRTVAAISIVIFGIIVFFSMLAISSGKKRRAKRLEKRAKSLVKEMQDILRKNGVRNREELARLRRGGAQDIQAAALKLRKEMDELKAEYSRIQIPLAPYISKYGKSIELENRDFSESEKLIKELQAESDAVGRQMAEMDSYGGGYSVTEPVPLVLDGIFAAYDDERLKRTLSWLSAQKNIPQMLILTCHRREQQLLKELDISFRYTEI